MRHGCGLRLRRWVWGSWDSIVGILNLLHGRVSGRVPVGQGVGDGEESEVPGKAECTWMAKNQSPSSFERMGEGEIRGTLEGLGKKNSVRRAK